MVSMSTVSPLISASHSELGNPAGALVAHLIHHLMVSGTRCRISMIYLVLLQLRWVVDFLIHCSVLNQGNCDL